jgi:anti-sigma B factor antagonist
MSYMLKERALTADTQVVTVGGELDMGAAPELRAAISRALEAGASTLVVDLSEATFIDSTTIGVLVATHRRLGLAGGSLELVCCEPNLLRVFEVVGINRELSIHATWDAALGAFAETR